MAEEARPRTATRLRGEAPPGLQLSGEEGRQHIGRYEVIKTIGKAAVIGGNAFVTSSVAAGTKISSNGRSQR